MSRASRRNPGYKRGDKSAGESKITIRTAAHRARRFAVQLLFAPGQMISRRHGGTEMCENKSETLSGKLPFRSTMRGKGWLKDDIMRIVSDEL